MMAGIEDSLLSLNFKQVTCFWQAQGKKLMVHPKNMMFLIASFHGETGILLGHNKCDLLGIIYLSS